MLMEVVARHIHLGLDHQDIHRSGKEVAVEEAVAVVAAAVEVEDPGELEVVEVVAFDVVGVLDVAVLVIVVVEGPNLVHLVHLPLCHRIGCLGHDPEMVPVVKDQHLVLVVLDRRFQLGEAELLLEPRAHELGEQFLPHT